MTQANPCVALLAVPCRGHGPICKECWTLISVDASEVIKRKYNMQNPDDMYCVKHKCWSGLRKYGPARDKGKCNKRYEEDGAADAADEDADAQSGGRVVHSPRMHSPPSHERSPPRTPRRSRSPPPAPAASASTPNKHRPRAQTLSPAPTANDSPPRPRSSAPKPRAHRRHTAPATGVPVAAALRARVDSVQTHHSSGRPGSHAQVAAPPRRSRSPSAAPAAHPSTATDEGAAESRRPADSTPAPRHSGHRPRDRESCPTRHQRSRTPAAAPAARDSSTARSSGRAIRTPAAAPATRHQRSRTPAAASAARDHSHSRSFDPAEALPRLAAAPAASGAPAHPDIDWDYVRAELIKVEDQLRWVMAYLRWGGGAELIFRDE